MSRQFLRGGAIGTHATGVWPEVTVLQALVILSWWHQRHRGAVTETQTLKEAGLD